MAPQTPLLAIIVTSKYEYFFVHAKTLRRKGASSLLALGMKPLRLLDLIRATDTQEGRCGRLPITVSSVVWGLMASFASFFTWNSKTTD